MYLDRLSAPRARVGVVEAGVQVVILVLGISGFGSPVLALPMDFLARSKLGDFCVRWVQPQKGTFSQCIFLRSYEEVCTAQISNELIEETQCVVAKYA